MLLRICAEYLLFVVKLKDFPLSNLFAFLLGPRRYRKRQIFGLMKNKDSFFTLHLSLPFYFLSPFTHFLCLCYFV